MSFDAEVLVIVNAEVEIVYPCAAGCAVEYETTQSGATENGGKAAKEIMQPVAVVPSVTVP